MIRLKTAYVDLQTNPPHPMIRCPWCNAWDRALSDAQPGSYECDACFGAFELLADRSKDTVPAEVRREMEEAKRYSAKIFDPTVLEKKP